MRFQKYPDTCGREPKTDKKKMRFQKYPDTCGRGLRPEFTRRQTGKFRRLENCGIKSM